MEENNNEVGNDINQNVSSAPVQPTKQAIEQNKKKQAVDSGVQKGGSALLQGLGVPKPIANMGGKAINKKLDNNPLGRLAKNKLGSKIPSGMSNSLGKLGNGLGSESSNKGVTQGLAGGLGAVTGLSRKDESSNENSEETKNESVDLGAGIKKIALFFIKHPGLIVTIATALGYILMISLIIFSVIALILYAQKLLTDIKEGVLDFFESLGNVLTFSGWRTNQSVYHKNIEGQIGIYSATTAEGNTVRYYVNSATFFTTMVEPSLLEKADDDKELTDEQMKISNELIEGDKIDSISNTDSLRTKYSIIKNDPISLIQNLYKCDSNESYNSCRIDEEKYQKYLEEDYVLFRYINCGNCEYKDKTDSEKKAIAKTMAADIIAQAKSGFGSSTADTQTDYMAHSIYNSGVRVITGTSNLPVPYKLEDYLSIKVANNEELSGKSIEVAKAYTLNEVSKLLVNYDPTSQTITENKFDATLVTEEIKAAVTETIKYRILKNDEVYYEENFDIFKAEQIGNNLENETYNDIIIELLGQDVKIIESIADGIELDTKTGFAIRVSPPAIDDPLYYGTDANGTRKGVVGLIGECAWYATNRAREITKTLNVTVWDGSANGNGYCDLSAVKNYNMCWGNDCEIKQGSIISWKYTGTCSYCKYGHVGIVESVNGTNAIISEGSVTKGNLTGGWSSVEDRLDTTMDRYNNCTSPKNTGCMSTSKQSIASLRTGANGRQIRCIIYLTEPVK